MASGLNAAVRRPLALYAAAFGSAVIFYRLAKTPWLCAAVFFLTAAVLFTFAWLRRLRTKRAVIISCALAAGLLLCFFSDRIFLEPALESSGKTGWFALEATDYATGYASYGRVYVRTQEGGDGIVPAGLKSVLYLKDGSPDISPGDRVMVEAKVSVPAASADFDTLSYYRGKSIFILLSQTGDILIEKAQKPGFGAYPQIVAKKLKTLINESLPEPESGLMTALITGDRSQMNSGLKYAMSVTGTSHTTAVSGMHVSFLVAMMIFAFGFKTGAVISLPAIIAFAAVAGFSPSSLRAVIMSIIAISAFFLKRESDSLSALSAAFVLMLTFNSYLVYDMGFMLSFLSTLGIIVFYGTGWEDLNKRFSGPGMPRPFSAMLKAAAATAAMTLAATAVTLPLWVVYFGRISVLAPLANIVIFWAVSAAFSAGIVLCAAGMLIPFAAPALVLVKPLLSYIINVITWLSKLPFSSVSASNGFFILFVLFCYGVFIVTARKPKNGRSARFAAAAVPLVFAAAVAFSAAADSMFFQMRVFRTENGRAMALVQGVHGVIIDAGRGDSDYLMQEIGEYLRFSGIVKAETLVLTSFSDESAGGAVKLLQSGLVKKLITPQTDGSDLAAEIERAAAAAAVASYRIYEKTEIAVGRIRVTLEPITQSEAAAVISAGGGIIAAQPENPYLPYKHFAASGQKCDILIVNKVLHSSKTELKKLAEQTGASLVIVSDDSVHASRPSSSGLSAAVASTAANGNITISLRIRG